MDVSNMQQRDIAERIKPEKLDSLKCCCATARMRALSPAARAAVATPT